MNKFTAIAASAGLSLSLSGCSDGQLKAMWDARHGIGFIGQKACDDLSIRETVERQRTECYFSPHLEIWPD